MKAILAASAGLVLAAACASTDAPAEAPAAPAAVAAAATPATPAAPAAAASEAAPAGPEYITIEMSIDVDRPAAATWDRVGGFCELGNWFNFKCEVSGPEGIGQVRHMGENGATEVKIAETDLSYGYVMPPREGEEANWNLYHGFLEAVPTSDSTTRLEYTLMYDVSMLEDQAAKDASVQGRRAAFERALATMKADAEGK